MAYQNPANPDPAETTTSSDQDFMLTLAMVFLLTMGVMMLIFSSAYLRDLQTLREVPDAIWSAICGQPVEGGIALPLLFTVGTLSFFGSALIFAYQRLRRHLQKPES